jgi:rhamnosyltransferase
MIKISVVVPTYNGGDLFMSCASSLSSQNIDNIEVLVVDSSSSDDTIDVACEHDFDTHSINVSEFNHGGTRNMALTLIGNADYVILLTQDAILNGDDSISTIIEYCDKHGLAAVCGRQLAHANASIIAAHARKFNYPSVSRISDINSIPLLGLKSAFCSNSFAVYRKKDLLEVGGFPISVIFGEDMYVAAKLILAGKKVGYCAEASVYHSHNYSIMTEFSRYFDVGVFHSREPWLLEQFGSVSGEGLKFVRSELCFIGFKPVLLCSAVIRMAAKLLAYHLGRFESKLPLSVCKALSMNKKYWVTTK